MLYFRESEEEIIRAFVSSETKKAMAVYGRRRTGKTELILNYIHETGGAGIVYFQAASFDYDVCLADFKNTLKPYFPDDSLFDAARSFKDLFTYLKVAESSVRLIIIDEFPFIAKKNENVPVEFQWIIDHGLGGIKLVFLGSNQSFMRSQISDSESPLYGRFDEILEVLPFSFKEVNILFPNFEDAVRIYAETGGVAQYVMFYKEYSSITEAEDRLFFNRYGRLFQESHNILSQEFRDVTTYESILRAIGCGEKDSSQIAVKCGTDARGIFAYLTKLESIGAVSAVVNPLSSKKKEKKYRISDNLLRFHFTFIEPNISIIAELGTEARDYVLGSRFSEYLGFVYEDIVRSSCYRFAAAGKLPFMPFTVGKWWGGISINGAWSESEVDLIAYNDSEIIVGECKYRNKAAGIGEFEHLKMKAEFIPVSGRQIHYLIASRSGFTPELEDLYSEYHNALILIDKTDIIGVSA